MNVLVVDDNPDSLYLLEKQLGAAGYSVVTARNGVEALLKLEQHSVDLIISDVLMPKMDGFQLCREVKSREMYCRIPLIFFTGTYTEEKDQAAGLRLGASRFIIKPQEAGRLVADIKAVLSEQASGQLRPPPPPIEESDFLKEYNERLVGKLEQKVQELRAALEQKQAAEAKLLEYQRDLQSLTSRLLLMEEGERRRFSQLLHDHIGQNLTGAKMKLEILRKEISDPSHREPLNETLALIEQMSQETRSLTYELSPPLLYEISLDAALEWLCEHFQKRYGLQCGFEPSQVADDLKLDTRVALFQSVRELLFNVVKHSKAKSACVKSARSGDRLTISVVDDGIGIPEVKTEGNSFGLFSVRERMKYIGGHVEIDSGSRPGSRISLVLDISKRH